MGFGFVERHQFASAVTTALSPQNVAASASKVGALDDQSDHLDILHKLELLAFLPQGKLEAYRAKLGIPDIHQAVISCALRKALSSQPPIPVVFHVIGGPLEGVEIQSDESSIYITVVRKGYDTPQP